jgi:putative ABC transport system permease protein
MHAVWLKIKADITSRPLISLLIVITVAVSSALFTLAIITLVNIGTPYDRTFKSLNTAHVWLYFDRDKMSRRDIVRVEALPGIVESTGLQYSVESRVRIDDTRTWVSFRAVPLEPPAVNRLLVQEGLYLSRQQDELLASTDLDDICGLVVGETIGVTREDGKEIDLPIIGLAYNPMWDTYRNSQPPYIYVSEETLRDLFPDESTWGWSVGLRLEGPNAVDETVALIEDSLRSDVVESYTDWRDVKESAIFGAQLDFIFLGTFSIFAILATTLVIASSIGSIVLSQFRQIGILKAVGFTPSQVLWLYLGQYLALSLIGCTLGLVTGSIISPLALEDVTASLNTSLRSLLDIPLVALVFGTVLGIVTLSSLGAAFRGSRANIIRSIAVGAEAPRKKSPWPVRLANRLGLPMVLILGVNDVFAKPFRSFLTGINLALGVIGIVFGLTLNETLDTFRTDPSLLGIVYDAVVTRDMTSDRKTQYLLHNAPGVEAFYGEYLVEVETPEGESFQIRTLEGDLEAFPFRINKGRFFQPNTYEAVAGLGLLDWLGLAIDDEIIVIFKDRENRPVTLQIVGQYPEPANAGQMLMVSLPAIAHLLPQNNPDTYLLKLEDGYNASQLRRYLQPRPDADLDLTIIDEAIAMEDVRYLQVAVFILSAILIGIALINVFNTSLLSMQEKLRMVGVLKAVGMTPAQVVTMANTAAGFLGFLATAAGIPLGLVFTQQLLSMLSSSYGFGEINTTLNILYAAGLVPLIVLVSTAGSTIPGQWAAKLSVVSVLRAE